MGRRRRGQVLALGSEELIDLASQVLARGERFPLRVTGASMQPWLWQGDLVLLGPVDGDRLAPGDVVLAGGPRPILHRVVRIDRGARQVITRGDAASEPDPAIPMAALVGRVVGVERALPLCLRRLLRAGRRLLAWR